MDCSPNVVDMAGYSPGPRRTYIHQLNRPSEAKKSRFLITHRVEKPAFQVKQQEGLLPDQLKPADLAIVPDFKQVDARHHTGQFQLVEFTLLSFLMVHPLPLKVI